MVTWLTPERRAFLREHYPNGQPLDEIIDGLAALEGEPLPDRREIGVTAWRMGLRRPSKIIDTSWQTEDRKAYILKNWAKSQPASLAQQLRRMPGPPVPKGKHHIRRWAAKLGVISSQGAENYLSLQQQLNDDFQLRHPLIERRCLRCGKTFLAHKGIDFTCCPPPSEGLI